MLAGFVIFFQGIQDNLEMLFISEKVSIGCIDEKCFNAMLPDITRIRFLDIEQIIVGYGQFIGTISFPDIFLELLNRCVQINQKIRLYQLLVNNIEEFLIQMKF